MDDDEFIIESRDRLADTPDSGGVDEERVAELCDADRDSLSAKQTAECTGAELAQLYENEEDGGS